MAATETINLSAQCLCKAHTFTTTVPLASLPLEASCCHCDSCRHTTGALYTCDAAWPGSFEDIRASSLRKYEFSPSLTIRSCGTCSTPIFYHKHITDQDDTFGVFTGALTNVSVPNLIKIVDHIFIGDTIDGGASVWMRHLNKDGSIPRCWKAGRNNSEELHGIWPPIENLPSAESNNGPAEISFRCHCRGVDLVLRRGDADFTGMQRDQLPWFVEPTSHKLLAGFDACDSCRLSFGSDVVNWSYSQLAHLDFPASDTPQPEGVGFPRTSSELKAAVCSDDRDPRFGTLAIYESSPDVQRYFCSHCSASVFYAVDDRPEMVDVAIGLLESPSGARAEDFLVWGLGSEIGSKADTVGGWRETFVAGVQKEADVWRIARGYPKSWRRIAKEEADAASS
ncbi:Mss4-like protein [Dactylonectria estremocensis]|uniref:Mss4-like protein n=1 Tax=Dactylonectria estremocensis TaxID=1079267 RepID=A0A9P9JF67_9HYPO|nr:Mss4-like protein [Dactylonectria estremocensis]